MDRLESFFIRIVNEAQEEKLPTSGAVSTTQIGGFLAAEDVTHSILDKLVAEPVEAAQRRLRRRNQFNRRSRSKSARNDSVLQELTRRQLSRSKQSRSPRKKRKPKQAEATGSKKKHS